MLEDVDDEVVVLGGVEGQVAGQEVLQVRGATDAVLRDHLLHGLPEVPPRVLRRLHHREAPCQRRRRRLQLGLGSRGRRHGWRLALSGRHADAGRVRAGLEAARRRRRRHGPPRLDGLALLWPDRGGSLERRVPHDVDVLVFELGFSPRRRLGDDRPERLFWPVLRTQVDDDLRGGRDHLAVQLLVPDEPVTAARRRGVRRLDRHHPRLAPASASGGHRRGHEPAAAAAADGGRCG
jgi:hypothetical protein